MKRPITYESKKVSKSKQKKNHKDAKPKMNITKSKTKPTKNTKQIPLKPIKPNTKMPITNISKYDTESYESTSTGVSTTNHLLELRESQESKKKLLNRWYHECVNAGHWEPKNDFKTDLSNFMEIYMNWQYVQMYRHEKSNGNWTDKYPTSAENFYAFKNSRFGHEIPKLFQWRPGQYMSPRDIRDTKLLLNKNDHKTDDYSMYNKEIETDIVGEKRIKLEYSLDNDNPDDIPFRSPVIDLQIAKFYSWDKNLKLYSSLTKPKIVTNQVYTISMKDTFKDLFYRSYRPEPNIPSKISLK
jgi:hypothetical protein